MSIEPLAGQVIGGTHAYAEKTIARGDTLHIRVSSDSAYQISIVGLGTDPDTPAQDTQLFDFGGPFGPQTQPIFPGSYINIEPSLAAADLPPSFTLECWIRPCPWPAGPAKPWRGIISQYSYPDKCGFGFFLDPANHLVFYAGSGDAFDATRLFTSTQVVAEGSWHHVAAVCDSVAGNIRLYLDGNEQIVSSAPGIAATPGLSPLRIGAYGENDTTAFLLD